MKLRSNLSHSSKYSSNLYISLRVFSTVGQFGTDSQIFCVLLALFVLPVCLLILFQTSEQGFFGAENFIRPDGMGSK